jgi:hypothetical protein
MLQANAGRIGAFRRLAYVTWRTLCLHPCRLRREADRQPISPSGASHCAIGVMAECPPNSPPSAGLVSSSCWRGGLEPTTSQSGTHICLRFPLGSTLLRAPSGLPQPLPKRAADAKPHISQLHRLVPAKKFMSRRRDARARAPQARWDPMRGEERAGGLRVGSRGWDSAVASMLGNCGIARALEARRLCSSVHLEVRRQWFGARQKRLQCELLT